MPAATSNAAGTRQGDPVNLVVIGEFETLLGAFAARWDESETISLATCWKTVKAFLLGSNYRYSPVSPSISSAGRSGYRAAANPRLDQRADPPAALALAAGLRGPAGLGGADQPRHRRAVHDAGLEPHHPPDRPRCRRVARLLHRRLLSRRPGARRRATSGAWGPEQPTRPAATSPATPGTATGSGPSSSSPPRTSGCRGSRTRRRRAGRVPAAPPRPADAGRGVGYISGASVSGPRAA